MVYVEICRHLWSNLHLLICFQILFQLIKSNKKVFKIFTNLGMNNDNITWGINSGQIFLTSTLSCLLWIFYFVLSCIPGLFTILTTFPCKINSLASKHDFYFFVDLQIFYYYGNLFICHKKSNIIIVILFFFFKSCVFKICIQVVFLQKSLLQFNWDICNIFNKFSSALCIIHFFLIIWIQFC